MARRPHTRTFIATFAALAVAAAGVTTQIGTASQIGGVPGGGSDTPPGSVSPANPRVAANAAAAGPGTRQTPQTPRMAPTPAAPGGVTLADGRLAGEGGIAPASGILSGFFGQPIGSGSSASPQRPSGPVDWSGVPYHKPQPHQAPGTPTPIRDPSGVARSPATSANGPTSSGRTSSGSVPAASRGYVTDATPGPSANRVPTPARQLPVAPPSPSAPTVLTLSDAEGSDRETGPGPLSREVSSRRTARRTVQSAREPALADGGATGGVPTPPEPVAGNLPGAGGGGGDDRGRAIELEPPQVARREIPQTATAKSTGQPTASQPTASQPSTGQPSTGQPTKPAPSTPPSLSRLDDKPAGSSGNAGTGSARAVPSRDVATIGTPTAPPEKRSVPAPGSAPGSAIAGESSAPIGTGIRPDLPVQTPRGQSQEKLAEGELAIGTPDGSSDQPSSGVDSAEPTLTLTETPGIRVTTRGPGQMTIEENGGFQIEVENRGSQTVDGLLVRAVAPEGIRVAGSEPSQGETDDSSGDGELYWTIDRLAGGETATLNLDLRATASGSFDLKVDWTLHPLESVTRVRVRQPQLQLTIDGPEEVVFGQSRVYRVRVRNPGDGIAPNVVFTLSPDSPASQTQRIGSIPPGKEALFEVELTAQDRGDLKIHGVVTGDHGLRASTAKTIRVTAADLEAILSGPEQKYQDTVADYLIEVVNHGTAASERVEATLRIPEGMQYLGGIDGGEQRGNQVRWEISALSPGVTREYAFRCRMTATGEQTLAFDCRGTASGETAVELQTAVSAVADLVMSVEAPAAPAPVGREVPYEVTVRNRGSKAAEDVRVVTQFAHGIEPQRVVGHGGEVLPGQVVFEPIGKIEAGEEIVLTVFATADAAGNHRFRAEVRSGEIVSVSEKVTRFLDNGSRRISRRSAAETAR